MRATRLVSRMVRFEDGLTWGLQQACGMRRMGARKWGSRPEYYSLSRELLSFGAWRRRRRASHCTLARRHEVVERVVMQGPGSGQQAGCRSANKKT